MKRTAHSRAFFRIVIGTICILLMSGCLTNRNSTSSKESLETFDHVWNTIKRTHWNYAQIQPKWDRARLKYRPKAKKAKTKSDLRVILNSLLAELDQSHYGIRPSDPGGGGAMTMVKWPGRIGLEFRSTQDGILVTRVDTRSSAGKAGVKPGWKLERIGDLESSDILKRAEEIAVGPKRVETVVGAVMTCLATGRIGDDTKVVFLDENDKRRVVRLEFARRRMTLQVGVVTLTGKGSSPRVHFEAETLDDGIGYFRLGAFMDPVRVMPAFRKHVRNEKHANGIIMDLRGNPGGIAAMMVGMARPFVSSTVTFGTMSMKGAQLTFTVSPTSTPVTCPVAILVDCCSCSCSEVFSGGLQEMGRAKVFGQRTAGLALPSVSEKLPNGDGFQYAIANYVSSKGRVLEKTGLMPNEVITLSRESLIQHGDPVMVAALKWIRSQRSK